MESSVSEIVGERFLRFLEEGEDEVSLPVEIEGPIAESSKETKVSVGGSFSTSEPDFLLKSLGNIIVLSEKM